MSVIVTLANPLPFTDNIGLGGAVTGIAETVLASRIRQSLSDGGIDGTVVIADGAEDGSDSNGVVEALVAGVIVGALISHFLGK